MKKDWVDVLYVEEAIKKIDETHDHMVDSFRYALIAAFYSKVEKFIQECLETKIYPPIKKKYGKFWMPIMLWIRGVKIYREETRNFEVTITIKQFGRVVVHQKLKR